MGREMRYFWILVLCSSLGSFGCGDDDGGSGRDSGTRADSGSRVDSGGSQDSGANDSGADDAGEDSGAGVTLRDVRLSMTRMRPHTTQRMEFRIVDMDNRLISNGILTSLPSASYEWFIPNAAPEGTGYRIDFFADLSGNGSYDAPPADHAWTLELPASEGVIDYEHNAVFDDIDTPALTREQDFTLNLTDMGPHVGQLVDVRVYNSNTDQVVGRWVTPSLENAATTVSIPGVIVDGVDYTVDFYADLDGDGSYDAPPTDHAWRRTGTATASGLSIDFAHGTDFTDIEF